jgi:hypothetical protein
MNALAALARFVGTSARNFTDWRPPNMAAPPNREDAASRPSPEDEHTELLWAIEDLEPGGW